jgi:transcription initiation factor TFIID subunit 1
LKATTNTTKINYLQAKTPKRLVTNVFSDVNETEGPEDIEKTKFVPIKFKVEEPDKSKERLQTVDLLSISFVSDKHIMDVTDSRPTGKVNKIVILNKVNALHHQRQRSHHSNP